MKTQAQQRNGNGQVGQQHYATFSLLKNGKQTRRGKFMRMVVMKKITGMKIANGVFEFLLNSGHTIQFDGSSANVLSRED